MKMCPGNQEDLALLAAGVLDKARREALLAHTARCPSCRKYLDELSEICREHTLAAERLPITESSIEFRRRLRERIRVETPATARHSWVEWVSRVFSWRWQFGPALAGVVLVLMFLTFWISPIPSKVSAPTRTGNTIAVKSQGPSQLWLTYQSAANRSYEALDALLARDAIASVSRPVRVTAGMRELAGLTE